MKKEIITVIVVAFCFTTAKAQVSEIKEKIDDSYEYYEDAMKKIKYALSSIDDCYNANSINDIQTFASDAESHLTSAKRYIEYAEDEADYAEDEASDIDCSDAEDKADDAEGYFYESKRKIASAISELSSASYEDDPDQLGSYLSNAKDYINEAIRKMKYAVDELNETLEELEACD